MICRVTFLQPVAGLRGDGAVGAGGGSAGLAIGGSKTLNRIFSPLIYLLYPIPKVVFVPVVILFLGIGDTAKIAIMFLILFFQIVVLVRDQAAGLPPS